MKLKILKDFPFAHRGCDVKNYTKGETVETDDAELVEVATAEKWAKTVSGTERQPPENKSKGDAPENKSTEADGVDLGELQDAGTSDDPAAD